MQHKNLASGKWFQLNLIEQFANIGSEVERTIKWRVKNKGYSDQAAKRVHELVWLTVSDPKNNQRLKEVCRFREIFNDWYYGDNIFRSSPEAFQKYFYQLNWLARVNKS